MGVTFQGGEGCNFYIKDKLKSEIPEILHDKKSS